MLFGVAVPDTTVVSVVVTFDGLAMETVGVAGLSTRTEPLLAVLLSFAVIAVAVKVCEPTTVTPGVTGILITVEPPFAITAVLLQETVEPVVVQVNPFDVKLAGAVKLAGSARLAVTRPVVGAVPILLTVSGIVLC